MTKTYRKKKTSRDRSNSARKARAAASTLLVGIMALMAAQPASAENPQENTWFFFAGDNKVSDENQTQWFLLYSDTTPPLPAGQSQIDVDPRLKLHWGHEENSTSTVIVRNGGIFNSAEFHVGHGVGSNSSMLVTGDGSLVATNGIAMAVGHYGTGHLRIDDGARMETGNAELAMSPGSEGHATVTGAGSQWQIDGILSVGVEGTGSLTVADAGAVDASAGIEVGGVTPGTGMTGSGTGLLSIESGGTVSGPALMIGAGPASTGEVIVTGSGSSLTAPVEIVVGNAGKGVLTVADGASVHTALTWVGAQAEAEGALTVTGSGSVFAGGATTVGIDGTGRLLVEDGGEARVNALKIGGQGYGAASVTGPGSLLDSAGGVIVGDWREGSLEIKNGGSVRSADGVGEWDTSIAKLAGSTGSVTISGEGSNWTHDGTFQIGQGGNGSLLIEQGGTATASAAIVAAEAGSNGSLRLDSGGVLETGQVALGNGAGSVEFGGGVLRLTGDQANLFDGFGQGGVVLGEDGAVIDTQTNSVASGAALSGSGGLTKTGAGTLTLTGDNRYTGGTTVDAGTLFAGAPGAFAANTAYTVNGGTLDLNNYGLAMSSLSGAGGVVDFGSASLTIDQATDTRYAGTIAGTGGVAKAGAGTLVLTGDHRYTGGTTISGGTLQLGDGGATGSIAGDVVNAGTLAFNRSDAITFGGTISGTGAVSQTGAGTTTLTADNSYTGGTTIGSGTLTGSAASFGTGGILDNAALVIDQPADAAFANALSGTGSFTKLGAGKLDMTGDSAAFSGATTVAAGTLAVNGALHGTLDVQAGARLQGNGTVGTTAVAGTVAPGNSIGTLDIAGDITFLPGSVYEVEMTPTQADRISATGTADLQGGTVRTIKEGGVYLPGSQWTILSAAGGVTGAFDTLDEDLPYVGLRLGYDANDVYLDIARNDVAFCLPGFTRNQCATANGVESLGEGSTLYDVVASQTGPQAAAVAFDQLSGEIHASARTALIEDSRFPRDAALGRLRSASGGVGASTAPVMTYGSDGPTPVAPDTRQLAGWGYGFGSWGHNDGNGNAGQLNHDIGGFLVGVDAPVATNARVGVISGYSRSSFNVEDRSSSGNSDNYYLGLFGGATWGNLALRGGAAYTWNEIDTRRSVAFPGFADSLRSSYSGQTAQVFGELGYEMRAGALALEPFAGLAYVNLHTDGYQENGGPAALSASSQSTGTTFSTLGLRASGAFTLGNVDFTARGTLGWRYAFGDTVPTATQSFAGGTPFTVAGVPIARNSAIVEAGLDVPLNASTTLGVSYDGVLGSRAQQHGFNLRLNVKF